MKFHSLYSLILCLLLAACGKSPETAKTPAPPATAKSAPEVSEAMIDAEIAKALTPSKAQDDNQLESAAEDILAQHPGKNAAELLNVPEVNASLRAALTKLGQDKALQNKINSTVELAAKMKGLEGTPGSVGLDLDIKGYDKARTSRMLQAVLSENPKRIVGFLIEEIGEAAPELSLGGADRASNGVAIKEQTPPPKPPASAPD